MSDLITDPKMISALQDLGRGLKTPGDLAKLSKELLKITVEASLNAEMEAHTAMANIRRKATTQATAAMAITEKP